MKILRSKYINDSDEFHQWLMVNKVIMDNMPSSMKDKWVNNGYEGLFSVAPQYFGMTKMHRPGNTNVTFEFTDEEWLMFCLKWL